MPEPGIMLDSQGLLVLDPTGRTWLGQDGARCCCGGAGTDRCRCECVQFESCGTGGVIACVCDHDFTFTATGRRTYSTRSDRHGVWRRLTQGGFVDTPCDVSTFRSLEETWSVRWVRRCDPATGVSVDDFGDSFYRVVSRDINVQGNNYTREVRGREALMSVTGGVACGYGGHDITPAAMVPDIVPRPRDPCSYAIGGAWVFKSDGLPEFRSSCFPFSFLEPQPGVAAHREASASSHVTVRCDGGSVNQSGSNSFGYGLSLRDMFYPGESLEELATQQETAGLEESWSYHGDSRAGECRPCPAPEVGACCGTFGDAFGVLDCVATSQARCAQMGGSFRGVGSTCGGTGTVVCPPNGPCCFPDGSCGVTTALACFAMRGRWGPAGARCVVGGCGPRGACCVNGVCGLSTRVGCAALRGVYLGDGTSCSGANPCALPRGVCCCREKGLCWEGVTFEQCQGLCPGGGAGWSQGGTCLSLACGQRSRIPVDPPEELLAGMASGLRPVRMIGGGAGAGVIGARGLVVPDRRIVVAQTMPSVGVDSAGGATCRGCGAAEQGGI